MAAVCIYVKICAALLVFSAGFRDRDMQHELEQRKAALEGNVVSLDRSVARKGPEPPPTPPVLTIDTLTRSLTARCHDQVQGLMRDLRRKCSEVSGRPAQSCESDVVKVFTGSVSVVSKHVNMNWWTTLATSHKDSMLWSGFWDGGEQGRTTMKALLNFANLVDAQTVHPSTVLGNLIESHGALQACGNDPEAKKPHTSAAADRGLVPNFWNQASQAFVRGIRLRGQSTIVALLNKGFDQSDPRNLYQSVFYNNELRQVAHDVFYEAWRPQILLVDLRGSCPRMRHEIEKDMKDDRKFAGWLQSKPVMCLNCPTGCSLDASFAKKVKLCVEDPSSCPTDA